VLRNETGDVGRTGSGCIDSLILGSLIQLHRKITEDGRLLYDFGGVMSPFIKVWEAGIAIKIERTEEDRILRHISVNGFTPRMIACPEESGK
jgi:hypothetical protein